MHFYYAERGFFRVLHPAFLDKQSASLTCFASAWVGMPIGMLSASASKIVRSIVNSTKVLCEQAKARHYDVVPARDSPQQQQQQQQLQSPIAGMKADTMYAATERPAVPVIPVPVYHGVDGEDGAPANQPVHAVTTDSAAPSGRPGDAYEPLGRVDPNYSDASTAASVLKSPSESSPLKGGAGGANVVDAAASDGTGPTEYAHLTASDSTHPTAPRGLYDHIEVGVYDDAYAPPDGAPFDHGGAVQTSAYEPVCRRVAGSWPGARAASSSPRAHGTQVRATPRPIFAGNAEAHHCP